MDSVAMSFGNSAISPLYTVNQIFFGRDGLFLLPQNIFGCIGLIIWSLAVVTAFKYLLIVLSAHHNGEGGPFVLKTLIDKAKVKSPKTVMFAGSLLILAVGLLIGDGMITPALGITSAITGLQTLSDPFPMPMLLVAIAILTAFFFMQQSEIPKIRHFFGPLMCAWFVLLGVIGIFPILRNPEILNALNPLYIAVFVSQATAGQLLIVFGSVLFVVVGNETLFANMGYSGRKAVTLVWFGLVFPALLINFLGQGAYLLSGGLIMHDNVFFSMVPPWASAVTVVLAVVAAFSAAQSWISMTYSLITQAIALQIFPRVRVSYIKQRHGGDIYLPELNWFLFLGAAGFLLYFRTSLNLASAYGAASAIAMLITTYAIFVIAAGTWKWGFIKVLFVLLPVFCIDLLFFGAGLLKVADGGYMPVEVAFLFFSIMKVWEWGRRHMKYAIESYHAITMKELVHRKIADEGTFSRSVIVMTPRPVATIHDHIPALDQLFINQDGRLPKDIIFLTVLQHARPYMYNSRYQINHFYKDNEKGQIVSVCMNFGYKEEPNVEKQLLGLARHRQIGIGEHPKHWLVHVLEEHFAPSKTLSPIKAVAVKLYDVLEKNSTPVGEYYGLGNVSRLSSEFIPVKINT